MTSAADFGAWQERACSLARGGEVRNPGGAWRRVQQRLTTRFLGQVDRWMRRLSWRRVYQEDDLKVMNLRRRMGIFQSLFRSVGARENSDGDKLPGFGSREAVDHVFVVGFVSVDLHRFEKLSHGLLGLRIWTQQ